MAAHPDPGHDMLRHTVATLAYRGGKAIRGAPADFGAFRIGDQTRAPLEILSHLGDLLEWAFSLAEGQERWPEPTVRTWTEEAERFYNWILRLDDFLASGQPLKAPPEKIFQGPIADALTHVGQLTMLRRLAGAPIRGENYFRADIAAGRVGPRQSAPRREFD